MPALALSPADLQGAQVIDQPTGGVQLSADDLAGAQGLDAPERPKKSWFESLARGAAQGATFGFADELTGALESAFTNKTYQQARDESRREYHQAEEDHPVVSTIGQVGGGLATALIPGGAIVKGGGFAAHALRGAGAGILSGLGTSEATDAEGVVKDAAKSGLAGGLVGGVLGSAGERLVRGAGDRSAARIIADVGNQANPKVRRELANTITRIGGDELEVGTRAAAKIIDDAGLATVARKPALLAPAAAEAKAAAGKEIGEFLGEVGGVPRDQVIKAMENEAARYRGRDSLAAKAIAEKIENQIDLLKSQWSQLPEVPAQRVNAFKADLQEGAFSGGNVTLTMEKRAEQDAARAVRRVIVDHVEQTEGKQAAVQYQALNDKFSVLSSVEKAARERAQREPYPKTGLRQIAHEVFSPAMLLASGHPYGAAAIAAKPLASAGARAADVWLARLYSASQSGQVTPQLIQQAIEAGVPRGLVQRFSLPLGNAIGSFISPPASTTE